MKAEGITKTKRKSASSPRKSLNKDENDVSLKGTGTSHDDKEAQRGCSCESLFTLLGLWSSFTSSAHNNSNSQSTPLAVVAMVEKASPSAATEGEEEVGFTRRSSNRKNRQRKSRNRIDEAKEEEDDKDQQQRSSKKMGGRRRPDALKSLAVEDYSGPEPSSPAHDVVHRGAGGGAVAAGEGDETMVVAMLTPSTGERFQEIFAPTNMEEEAEDDKEREVNKKILLQNFLVAFQDGQKVIIHSKEVAPRKAALFIEGEQICWNFDSAYYAFKKGIRKMPLSSIKGIKIGKTSEAFKRKVADTAPPDNCITIISADKALAIQWSNQVCQEAFAQGINLYLQMHSTNDEK